MAELKLVDESLGETEEIEESVSNFNASNINQKKRKFCPYVLALYDAFASPKTGLINLVVEYMDGGSLADVVKAGGCNENNVLADISWQVLEGLKYLHDFGQVHRDIKPGKYIKK